MQSNITLIAKIEFTSRRPITYLCGMVIALSGCTTSKLDLPDSERFPAPQAIVVDDAEPLEPVATTGLANTGRYPTFSKPLRAASAQMSDEDAALLQKNLDALARKRKAGAIGEAEYNARVEELRRLAAQHGNDTIKEIQN